MRDLEPWHKGGWEANLSLCYWVAYSCRSLHLNSGETCRMNHGLVLLKQRRVTIYTQTFFFCSPWWRVVLCYVNPYHSRFVPNLNDWADSCRSPMFPEKPWGGKQEMYSSTRWHACRLHLRQLIATAMRKNWSYLKAKGMCAED